MHAIFEVRICGHFGAISIYSPKMLGSRDPGHTEVSKKNSSRIHVLYGLPLGARKPDLMFVFFAITELLTFNYI